MRDDLKQIERESIVTALERAHWRISGAGGTAAFVAAGCPGASDRELREAEQLASGLPFQFQYLTEEIALKVLVRDLETRKVVGLICRWSRRPGLVSLATQQRAVSA